MQMSTFVPFKLWATDAFSFIIPLSLTHNVKMLNTDQFLLKLDVLLLQNLTHKYQSAQTLCTSYNNDIPFEKHGPFPWP